MTRKAGVHLRIPLGVVVRRVPGVTRWAKWHWRAVAVLPGAGPADWAELRREGDAIEYHAATLPLTLWAVETEAYMVNLGDSVPSIYVILRNEGPAERPLIAVLVTASPYEAQDYADSGEEIVEKVPMSQGLLAVVKEFALEHHVEDPFVKRRRDKRRTDLEQDGVGDSRIRQDSDVYRAPRKVVQ